MTHRLAGSLLGVLTLAFAAGCGDDGTAPSSGRQIAAAGGNTQTGTVGTQLAQPLTVQVSDSSGNPLAGVTVNWAITGGGTVAPTSVTDATGIAAATVTLGVTVGTKTIRATLDGAGGSPVSFTATAVADAPAQADKSLADSGFALAGQAGIPVQVVVTDQHGNPVSGVVVNWALTGGGGSLAAASSSTNVAGVASVSLTPGGTAGTNTVTATVGALPSVTLTVFGFLAPTQAAAVAIPPNYGIHDTFVRDGLAFVNAWNTGIQIYDVGNGISGGTPANPMLVGSVATVGGQAHNSWWFHNPVTAEEKYLFVGEEGPGSIGSNSSGDIHVVDVSDLANPVEVASYHLNGAGAHNFWMDEPAQILYAAFYNGGVVALDVSGSLSGDLASREIARIAPGGSGNTYVWGVQLVGNSLYAIDMLSGFWQLRLNGASFNVLAGGNNVPERFSSDLWVHGGYGYTGTWGGFPRNGHQGNAIKIWQLDPAGAPALPDSVIIGNISTVSDVEVTPDGKLLVASAEGGVGGFYFYSLMNPAKPKLITSFPVGTGIHTVTTATIGGRLYAFGAKNPGSPQLVILDITGLQL